MTPKFGLMDLSAKIPFEINQGIVPVRVRLKNAMNLGVELGMETASPWFLLRLWGAADVSGYVGGFGSIKSLRTGADTYWDIYEISDRYKLSLLIFGFGEKLVLGKKGNNMETSAEVDLQSIDYLLGMVGMGLTLAW